MDEMPSRPKRPIDANSPSVRNRKAKSPRIEASDKAFSEPANNSVSRTPLEGLDEDQIKALLESLDFDQIDSRHDTIHKAYGKTCVWLSETSEYLDWLEPDKLHEHHGFLWIKGHPGAGKSTLMKSALHSAQETEAGDFISYFFNARGDELEKSTIGMYRSLLFKLLKKIPRLQIAFNSLGRTVRNGRPQQWSIESLKSVFEHAVRNLEDSPLTCFIDALDECGVTQIRDMISFFESISEMTTSRGISFRVCLSSRHYPHITISKGLSLDLGQQEGHDRDIVSYAKGKLKIGGGKLAHQVRTQLIEKASGIFIWIVLVVGILQQEHDDGYTHTLLKRLKDIPGDLNELFQDILSRDSRHTTELRLCIQWVLFARQSLQKEQLHLAILVGVDPVAASKWDADEIEDEVVRRFILSSSKGLVEVNKSRNHSKVQFIHESVREFFLKDGLRIIWPELKGDFRGESHEKLKQCCLMYMSIAITNPSFQISLEDSTKEKIKTQFPFLEYAFRTVLYHSNEAAAFGVDQVTFLQSFDLAHWKMFEFLFEQYKNRLHWRDTSLLYILAEYNAAKLIEYHPDRSSGFKAEEGHERYGMPVLAAVATNSRQAVYTLLKAQADAEPPTSLLHSLCEQYDQSENKRSGVGRIFQFSKNKTVLENLVAAGDEQVVMFAIASARITGNIAWKGLEGETALFHAARIGNIAMVKLLLNNGASAQEGSKTRTALHAAARGGHTAVLQLLLDRGANINPGGFYTPLQEAVTAGHVAAVRLLLDRGANTNARSSQVHTTLSLADSRGHFSIKQLLLDKGAKEYQADVVIKDWWIDLYTTEESI